MKLNRKGYMLVEIVIASVLAFGIAYYLLNLTYKFKNTNTDLQESYIYTKDKLVITKNIMSDLENGIVSEVNKIEDGVTFKIRLGDKIESRKLVINKENKYIEYGKTNDSYSSFITNDSSYYKKELEKSLDFNDLIINNNDASFNITISLSSMYTDNVYNIRLYSSFEGGILLSNKEVGSYVNYVGNNGCNDDSCRGLNANYVNDGDMGYCSNQYYKFKYSGWRIAYINNGSVHLVSAGSPECLCTDSRGISSNANCTSSEVSNNGAKNHINNLNEASLKYCNSIYAYGGICNENSTWNINSQDFKNILGRTLSSSSCFYSGDSSCGLGNDLINIGGFYWYASPYSQTSNYPFGWAPDNNVMYFFETKSNLGVRPIIKLNTNIIVVGGDGTKESPYEISIAD